MREKEILCRILTFYPSRIRGPKRHWIPDPDPQHCLCLQGEEAEGGDTLEGDPVPDPDFLPITDPGSGGQKGTGSRIRYTDGVMCREKKQKAVMRDSGSRFRMLTFYPSRIRGVKKAPDPGSATLMV
jgi:hypothetical protein